MNRHREERSDPIIIKDWSSLTLIAITQKKEYHENNKTNRLVITLCIFHLFIFCLNGSKRSCNR